MDGRRARPAAACLFARACLPERSRAAHAAASAARRRRCRLRQRGCQCCALGALLRVPRPAVGNIVGSFVPLLPSQVLDCLRAIEKARDAGLIDFHKAGSKFSLDEYVHYEQVRSTSKSPDRSLVQGAAAAPPARERPHSTCRDSIRGIACAHARHGNRSSLPRPHPTMVGRRGATTHPTAPDTWRRFLPTPPTPHPPPRWRTAT